MFCFYQKKFDTGLIAIQRTVVHGLIYLLGWLTSPKGKEEDLAAGVIPLSLWGWFFWLSLLSLFVFLFSQEETSTTVPLLVSPFFWPNQEVNAFAIDLLL